MFIRNFWSGIVWGILIFILSAIPGNYFPRVQSLAEWLSPDKVVHFILYFVFYYLIGSGIIKQYQTNLSKLLFWAVVITVSFGGLIEILQYYFFTGRNGNVYDFLANLLGCTLSYIVILYIQRKKSSKSNRA